jgi:hypothetical protein
VRRTALTAAALTAGLLAAALASGPVAAAPAPDAAAGGPVFTGETTKSVIPALVRSRAGKPGSTSTITYHNGPVMTAATGTNIYYVWYGSWTDTQKAIVTDFGNGVGGTPYFGINTSYYDAAKKYVTNKVTLAGQVNASTALGNALSDAQIQAIITNEITAGTLPSDPNGIYFLLTGAGVTATSGFLTQYCGWHTYTTLAGTAIKYSFVGNAAGASLGNCAAQTASSPNGDPGVDAMISVFAHELVEAVTDPQLNAWYDRSGYENADKCAWTFGTTSTATNGSKYNVTFGGRQWLIQRNWKASTQACTMS